MAFPRRKAGIVLILVVVVIPLTLLHSCTPTFRTSRKEMDSHFLEHKVTPRYRTHHVGYREIHYVETGDTTRPLVLFIHGSPGSMDAFFHFLVDTTLLQRAVLISTDRPGFGWSNFGVAEPSLKKQAMALKPILEKYAGNKPRILVGHSLGGPLIVKMAMEYPELVDGLIIVAGSIDPELEPDEVWFRAPLATPFLSWLLPRSLRSSNEEIYKLKPELEEMIPYWKDVTCPVIVIQGKVDELVPYENIEFAKKMLINAPVEFVIKDDMNHYVPWSNPELIRDAVMKMLEKRDSVAARQ